MRNFQDTSRSIVYSSHGMASTSHSLSTQSAIRILQKGGNAMDAAIAACAVQCVLEPGSTGIGGDCFCLYSPEGSDEIIAFNGSGKAPANTDADALYSQGLRKVAQTSPHAVTIPGAVDAWVRLNAEHGRLSLKEILDPAITYANEGYIIAERVAYDFANAEGILRGDSDTEAVFLPEGRLPQAGDRQSQPKLGKTLALIAENGADAFYQGWVCDDMLEKLQKLGGIHNAEDFRKAQGEYVSPTQSQYKDFTLWQCPPNGQGIIAQLLMNIMEGIDTFGKTPYHPLRIHHEIEAGRLAYRDRGVYIADPDHYAAPIKELLSHEYAAKLRGKISEQQAMQDLPICPLPHQQSTVYISVVDKDRNACSFINSLFHGFGSGIMAPKSGVLLQSRGYGFVLQPNHSNRLAPNKRPLHTIIPGMVTKHGKTQLCYGVMGGDYQAFGHMQFLTRLWDYGMSIQEAQNAPRFFPDPFENTTEFEHPISPETIKTLSDMGHRPVLSSKPIGGSQAIAINWQNNSLLGGSDPRKDGCALGY